VRAFLHRRFAVTLTWLARLHIVNRTVPVCVASEIKVAAVFFAGEQPRAASGHLHIKAGRFSRPKTGDQIDALDVGSDGQNGIVGYA
jgi:hypothetical protein